MRPAAILLRASDAEQRREWDGYVDSRPDASGYHRSVWLEVLRAAFGHAVFPLACRAAGGGLSGVLPLMLVSSRLFGRFLVSLPFVNDGGALADDAESAEVLLAEAGRLMDLHGARSVELRRAVSPAGLGGAVGRSGHKAGMVLDLCADPERLWGGLKDKVRNQVRKARKEGLEAIRGRGDLLDEFYRVFCVNMRALGTPVYGRGFFAEILARLPEETEIVAVRKNGRTLAAGLLYRHGHTLEMPWASSLPDFRPLCANPLLYWEALRGGCLGGARLFDFGRSTPQSGPWRFKKQWGAREIPLRWDYLLPPGQTPPELTVGNPRFRLAIAAWKRLPLPLANFFGPRIVRCIP